MILSRHLPVVFPFAIQSQSGGRGQVVGCSPAAVSAASSDTYTWKGVKRWRGGSPTVREGVTAHQYALPHGRATAPMRTPTGATQDKAGTRNALEDVLFLMCEALGALAHISNDQDLLALTDITRSGIDKLDSEALSNRAALVLAQANEKKTELATLQVTQAKIDELDQALQSYNTAKAGPRQATVTRVAQTESLSTLIREANDILRNRIDKMVNLFGRSHPQFVSSHQAARVIVDRAASHASAKAATSTTPAAPKA